MTFAIDFDGTLVENKYPLIGSPKIDMIQKAIDLQREGHQLILWTCRTGTLLEEAVNFLKEFGLAFDYVNTHSKDFVDRFGEGGSKIGADYYVDDKNLSLDEFISFDEGDYNIYARLDDVINSLKSIPEGESSMQIQNAINGFSLLKEALLKRDRKNLSKEFSA